MQLGCQNNNIDFSLSKTDTSALKGIGILGMLLWHLFYAPNPCGVLFPSALRYFAIAGDFCVSAFLFVSGYGLTVSYTHSTTGNVRFILRRLLKFYVNFWFIFLIFVPIGIFCFHVPMDSSHSPVIVWIKQIFAISGQESYNSAWWFNLLIITYYILFPLLFVLIRKLPKLSLLIVLLVALFLYVAKGMIHFYVFIFVCGMLWAYYHKAIGAFIGRFSSKVQIATYIAAWSLVCIYIYYLMVFDNMIFLTGMPAFWMMTILIAMGLKRFSEGNSYRVLGYFGKHSGNVYMVHSFFYYYWFPSFFFSLSPVFTYITLFGVSLLTSEMLERTKEAVCWNKIANILT